MKPLLLAVLLAACGKPQFWNTPNHVVGYRLNNTNYFYDAQMNWNEATRRYRETEWRFNKHEKNRPPRLCLALSGGGSRAAAFSMGVMRALAERQTLADVDLISGASGGTYAMAWYYLQHLRAGSTIDPKVLFDPKGPYQTCLENNSALVPKKTLLPLIAMDVGMTPVNLLLNGVFGWHYNTTPSRRFYEYRIKELYARAADRDCGHFKNFRAFFWPLFGRKHTPFATVRAMLENGLAENAPNRLPLFIVNTTVSIDQSISDFDQALANAIFEFTPLSYGSDEFPPAYESPPFGFDRSIAISGAALDSAIIAGSSQKTLFSAANLDLGYYARNTLNPEQVGDETVFVHRLLPFPAYFTHHYLKDRNGIAIYLTDGGHAENLATFSLVRRLCDRIIVVDAEYDPQWDFKGYEKLRNALRSEMNVDFTVPAIEAVRRQPHGQHVFDATRPVMRGAIGCFPELRESAASEPPRACVCGADCDPLNSCNVPGWHALEVDYVKLSLDVDHLEKIPETVRRYYDKNREECRNPRIPFVHSCGFPQQSTTDQWFSPDQFVAYRDLGYTIGTTYDAGRLGPPATRGKPATASRRP